MSHDCFYEDRLNAMEANVKLLPAIHKALLGDLNGTPGLIAKVAKNTSWRLTVMAVLKWFGGSVIALTIVGIIIGVAVKKIGAG